jgi:hypothetical protein
MRIVSQVTFYIDENPAKFEQDQNELDSLLDSLLLTINLATAKIGKPGSRRHPTPDFDRRLAARNCDMCSYTKVVNGVCEQWDEWGQGDCENCGVRINSYTVRENGKIVEDVIEMWGYEKTT